MLRLILLSVLVVGSIAETVDVDCKSTADGASYRGTHTESGCYTWADNPYISYYEFLNGEPDGSHGNYCRTFKFNGGAPIENMCLSVANGISWKGCSIPDCATTWTCPSARASSYTTQSITCNQYSGSAAGSAHSACATDDYCGSAASGVHTVSQADNEKVVEWHNDKRSLVAQGTAKVQKATNPLNNQQVGPAMNMLKLTWNSEAAAIAQKWADRCEFAHETYNNRRDLADGTGTGQNIYISYGGSGFPTPQTVYQNAVDSWYDEINDMDDMGRLTAYVAANSTNGLSVIGHFTQVVYGTTEQVGCAIKYSTSCKFGPSTLSNCALVVCNYVSGGNVGGKPVFSSGAASCASGCTMETSSKLCIPQ